MSLNDVFTPKQKQVVHAYLNEDFKYMILAGAVRSGKTYIDNFLFLMDLRRAKQLAEKNGDKHPQYILAGYSSGTIYNNVISSLEKQFGFDLRTDRHGHYNLFGIDIVPAFTGSIRGLGSIRGMTSYGAYVNEASLAVEDVFQEIVSRCSVEHSHIIADSNPDNPQHWLKTKFIDNDDPKARTVYYHFTIDDNPTLAPDYVESLKASKSGMFYERDILGLWVTGEGTVYSDFDKSTMVIERSKLSDSLTYTAGVDWGFDHPTAIMVVGHDDKGNYYLVDEAYGQFQQVDPHWIGVAQEFRKKYGANMPFWCDTARTEHIRNFQQHHINAKYGYKNVLDGVEKVAALIEQHKFYVVEGAAPNFINEIYQYVWDEKTGAPVKDHDHAQDAVRYCIATPLWRAEQKRRQNKDRNRSTDYLNDLGLI
ncbi:PBSX family phage terminase large subunit [Limosilactobacillus oris]|uniref:PBSX family phage terminase large subunit n=1 Tax=Limosilactobacillus oris TaxID=1632 RepID=UPI00388FE808